MKKLLKNYLVCGMAGCFIEIIFTALHSLRRRDLTLTGHTSLWMFPIYGLASLIYPVSKKLSTLHVIKRGMVYTAAVFIVEFITGTLLQKRNLCPWNYRRSRWNISGVIRLDYAANWFLMSLGLEKLLESLNKDCKQNIREIS